MAAAKSESAQSETEAPEEAGEVKETEELAGETGSNGGSTPKQDNVEDVIHSESYGTFSYDQLNTKSDNPVTGIDYKRREVSLALLLLDYF